MKKSLILVVLVGLWAGGFEAVWGQESPKEKVESDRVAEYSVQQAYSPLLIEKFHAARNDAIVNCWKCHDGNVALVYTPDIHQIHQGLLIAQASEAGAYLRTRFFLINSVHNPLGIEVGVAEQALRKQLKLEDNQGLVVLSVPDESDGAKVGLKPFDVLISIDQHQIASGEQLQAALKSLAEKDVTVLLMREGKMTTLSVKLPSFVTLDSELAGRGELRFEPYLEAIAPYRIGVTLTELNAPLRQHLKLESGGLLISDVLPDSPAAAAGLQPNDVLVRCNDHPVITVEEINQMIQEIKTNPAKLSLIRTGEPIVVEVTPKQEPTDRYTPMMLDASVAGVFQREFVDFRIDLLAASDPFQTELAAIQKALDDLKAKIALANAAAKEKPADQNSKPSEPSK